MPTTPAHRFARTPLASRGHRSAAAVCFLSVVMFASPAPQTMAEEDASVPAATLHFDNDTADLALRGRDARVQLVLSRVDRDGRIEDATRVVTYSTQPAGVVEISPQGFVTPLADGTALVLAQDDHGLQATAAITVTATSEDAPLSFPGRIVPIFTKLGCNGGGCHGKAAGQNGFKLSLLGFEPQDDYKHLVGETRGRRVSPALPDRSLLLLKAVNASPHGGGQRLEVDSHEYRLLRRWIAQGMPYGDGSEPTVTSIEVLPDQRRLFASATQQLSVVATYSDGSREDVTRAAVFESNDTEMAEVDVRGLVKLNELVGDVAVMARFQGQVTVFRADIPLRKNPSVAGQTTTPAIDANESSLGVVDQFVNKKLTSLGIPASAPCDDVTFLRRVTLDIAGRLPTLAETTAFVADTTPEKRDSLVTRLLESEDHASYFASKWNTILRNKRQRGELHFSTVAFHDWIRHSIRINKPYDEFVREIVTASGSIANNPPVAWYQQVADTNQRVEDAAQLFLGQRIQCARCHHHPYEKWSQADYTKLLAFFTTVTKKIVGDPLEPTFATRLASATSPDPKSGQQLAPAGLDGETIPSQPSDDPRLHLANWMTDPTNPFFARAIVNRYWKHFMGRGLIEPEDDLRITNPPSNPELLDGLANSFVESGYDLKQLIRNIVLSRAYAFDSEPLEDNLGDRRSYSRFYPKRLQAEVLLDAVDQMTESPTRFAGMPPGTRAVALPDTGFSSYFLQVFGQPTSSTACECERTQDANLAQSLHLLNSEEMQKKLADDRGRAARLASDTSRGDDAKVVELYQTAFSRSPSDDELKATLTYLSQKENRREAFEDILWSLINSKEFLFNH